MAKGAVRQHEVVAANLGYVLLAAQAHGDIQFAFQDFEGAGDARFATGTKAINISPAYHGALGAHGHGFHDVDAAS